MGKRSGRSVAAALTVAAVTTFAPISAAAADPLVPDPTTTTSTSAPADTTTTTGPTTTTSSEPVDTTTSTSTPDSTTSTTTPDSTTSTTTPDSTSTTTPDATTTTTTTPPPPPDVPDEEGDGGPPPAAPPVPPRSPETAPSQPAIAPEAIVARRQLISEQDAGYRTMLDAYKKAEADIRARIATAEKARADAQLRVEAADAAVAEVEERTSRLNEKGERAVAELAEAKKLFNDMVVQAFQRNVDDATLLIAAANSESPNDVAAASTYADLMGEGNADAAAEYTKLRDKTKKELVALSDELSTAELELENATGAQAAETAKLDEATADLGELGLAPEHPLAAAAGWRFPVAGDHNFIDSWGFPRSGGRVHKGADIFAAWGTPVVAIERGVISKIGTNSLGGLVVWLQGESGNAYYFAHLAAYAPGLAVGQVVDGGTLVGYVGNTGNAITTPPHLHFEVHPGGGDAVNPYPLLKGVSDADAAFPPPAVPYAPLVRPAG
jgi:murein DD-endopeptidase MepM/ murein hydrolase activator NlpD